jgi:hypothetical protein
MSRKKPNIDLTAQKGNDIIRSLTDTVFANMWVSTHTPDLVELDGFNFTLTLYNKKFTFDPLDVDTLSDYIDIYLQGIRIEYNTYSVVQTETDLVITFNKRVTRRPDLINKTHFTIKGKIVNR